MRTEYGSGSEKGFGPLTTDNVPRPDHVKVKRGLPLPIQTFASQTLIAGLSQSDVTQHSTSWGLHGTTGAITGGVTGTLRASTFKNRSQNSLSSGVKGASSTVSARTTETNIVSQKIFMVGWNTMKKSKKITNAIESTAPSNWYFMVKTNHRISRTKTQHPTPRFWRIQQLDGIDLQVVAIDAWHF